MRTILATDSNDFSRGMSGNLSFVTGAQAVAQLCRQAMQARRGEMIFDVTGGIPFAIVAWNGEPNLAQFEAAARVRLRQVEGVREILAFDASISNDVLSYVAVIQTDYGEVTVNE